MNTRRIKTAAAVMITGCAQESPPTTMSGAQMVHCDRNDLTTDQQIECIDWYTEHLQATEERRERIRSTAPRTTSRSQITQPPRRPQISGIEFGQHRVGTDIRPGRRTFEIEPPWDRCYWERLSGFSGESEDIIANEHETGSRFTVDIAPTDAAFEITCYDIE